MKKIISMLLVVMLIAVQLIPTLNVEAADINVIGQNQQNLDPTLIIDEGTITVTGVDSNDTFKAYKLLDAFYNEQSNEIRYDFTTEFNTFLQQSNNHNGLTVDDYFAKTSGSSTGKPYADSTLDILVSEYTTYIRNNNINGINMTTSGTSASVTVPSGAYLVLPDETMNVYAVMVGNVVYEVQDGNWVLKNSNIVAKKTDILSINFITTLEPEWLRENIKNINDAYGLVYNSQAVKEKSFKLGEEYTNIVAADVRYPANVINEKFKIEIEIDEGISVNEEEMFLLEEYNGNWLTVEDSKIYSGNEVVGTCLLVDNKIIVEYDKFNAYYHDYYKGKWIYIFYRSSLNENAVVGGDGNKTQAMFTYANDPYDMNSQHTISIEPTTVYTYGLKINNYGDEDKTKKLNGSVFDIYSDSDLTTKIGSVNIEDGTATFIGLAEGTYYLKQIKSASGYKLLADTLEFEVSKTLDYTTMDIVNTENGFLPSTGGIGTIIYTLIGLLVIGISSVFVIKYKKQLKLNNLV